MNPFRFITTAPCPKDPGHTKAPRLPGAALSLAILVIAGSLLWMQNAQADEGLLRGPRKTTLPV